MDKMTRLFDVPLCCKLQLFCLSIGLLISLVVTCMKIFRNPAVGIQLMDYLGLPPVYLPDLTSPTAQSFNYTFLVSNDETCMGAKDGDVFLLVLVTSSVPSIRQRVAIRNTWAGTTLRGHHVIKTRFLIGKSPTGDSVEENLMITEEQAKYQDLIQADMPDTYQYLTQKTGAALYWAKLYCPHAKFVFKSDDDSFNILPRIVDSLSGVNPGKDYVSGECASGLYPFRDKSHKWYVSRDAYPDSYYPLHLKGRGYLMSQITVHRLLQSAPRARSIPMEDVFWTGISRVLAGVSCTCHSGFVTTATMTLVPCDLAGHSEVMNIHYVTAEYMERYWQWYTADDVIAACRQNRYGMMSYSLWLYFIPMATLGSMVFLLKWKWRGCNPNREVKLKRCK